MIVPVGLSAGAALYLVLAILGITHPTPLWIRISYGIGFIVFGVSALLFWYATLYGKFRTWATILDSLSLQGTEQALDLGCGRGAVIIATALRLPQGHATGIDLWRSRDQTGNSASATLKNAELNDVAQRITLDTGDMTRLPYPDASFDLVTASVSIHNIPSAEGRARAVSEALRVLRPGGHLIIVDISRTKEYITVLNNEGIELTTTSAGLRMQWGALPSTIIRARKSTGS